MSRFNDIISFVKEWETEYARGHSGDDRFVLVERNPKDPGGTTKWGLDARSHGSQVAKLSWDEAKQIYLDWYWNGQTKTCKWDACEAFPEKLGEVAFDTRINSGFKIAQRFLRETRDPLKFLALRDQRNRYLASVNPDLREFLQGWLNRTRDLRRRLGLKT